jgi:hypothetical protein
LGGYKEKLKKRAVILGFLFMPLGLKKNKKSTKLIVELLWRDEFFNFLNFSDEIIFKKRTLIQSSILLN